MTSLLGALAIVFSTPFYFPPSSFVTLNWLEQLRGTKNLFIRQETTFIDSSFPGGQAVVEESIWIKRPNLFRKSSKMPNGKVEVVFTPRTSVKISNGSSESVSPFEAYGPEGIFYLADTPKKLTNMLGIMGIVESGDVVPRGKGEVVYQVGTPGAAIYFFNDDWIPAGVTMKSMTYEFKTNKSKNTIPYPERIEVKEKDKILQTTIVKSVTPNVTFPDSTFDVNLLTKATAPK